MSSESADSFRNAAEGAIVSIQLQKFVNFLGIEFHPLPRLNIIIAPNGSGKSTLMSAIVLGLGGSPAVIGRSSHEVDYIMSGQNKALIQIEVNNPHGRNHFIKRLISRKPSGSASTEWFINNNKVTAAQVQDLVKKLNIQVDNLCQVLPQDRVQDFAKMNRIELFSNTQKVMGDSNLYKNYQRILELRSSHTKLKINIDATSKKHESAVQAVDDMGKDMEVVAEHQKVLKSVKTCSQKLAWAVFNEKKSKLDDVSGKMKEKEDELKKVEEQGEPLRNKLRILERKAASCKKDLVAKGNSVVEVQNTLKRSQGQVAAVRNSIASMKAEAEEAARSRERCLEEASQLETQLSDHERKLADFNEGSVTSQINDIDREYNSLVQKCSELRVKLNQLKDAHLQSHNEIVAIERSLSQVNSGDRMKLDKLQRFPGAHGLYDWIKNNRQNISAPVHNPIFMELNVQDVNKAKYIENIVPQRDLIAFVAETSQATTELLTMRSRLQLKCNVICSEPPDCDLRDAYPPVRPLSQLRSYGFDCYLIDLVKGHPAVLAYLCRTFNIHNIPIAYKPINSANVPSDIRVYMAGDIVYSVTVSKYSHQTSTSSRVLKPANLLVASTDHELVAKLNDQLESKRRMLESLTEEQNELKPLERENEAALNQLRNRKRELMATREMCRGTLVRVKRLRDERQRLIDKAGEPQVEGSALYNSIKKAVENLMRSQESLISKLRQYTEAKVARELVETEMDALSVAIQAVRENIDSASDSTSSIKRELVELRQVVDAAKQEVRELQGIAKRATNSLAPDHPQFKKQFENAFNRLPSTVADLTEKLNSLKGRARCLHNPLHEQILAQYESQKAEAAKLKEALDKMTKDFEVENALLRELMNDWMSKINQLISKINESFSAFFRSMGCCGEIGIDKGTNEEEIEKYGLEMKVKFRDSQPLTVVDGVTHSGGEKALATAVYLLSLQKLSFSPFHCMDEINQGMDEFNERRVYNLLFNTITDVPSQFFLVSPKLLKNLDYPSHATVHTIFNSGSVCIED